MTDCSNNETFCIEKCHPFICVKEDGDLAKIKILTLEGVAVLSMTLFSIKI